MITTDKPTLQDFHIPGVRHITPGNAYAALQKGEAIILDVREDDEFKTENIPLDNVIHHPMSVILDRLAYIPRDKYIITVCPGGVRSSKVANLLMEQGYPNVVNLDGGLTTWKSLGLPLKSNVLFSFNLGCGGGTKP